MPGSPSTSVLSTPDARDQEMYIALVANDTVPTTIPKPVNVTSAENQAASATAVALTIDSVVLPTPIRPGQFLVFKDATGSYLFQATVAASGTVTELTGIPLEGIPDNSVAQFPARFELALNIDTSETTGTSTFSTFDHNGVSEVARGEGEQSITTGAGASYYNAGLETLIYAQRNGIDVCFVIENPNPDSDSFSSPPYEWGVGVVNDVSKSGGVNDKSQRTVGISVKNGMKFAAPVKAA
jgi:hypothetical protein